MKVQLDKNLLNKKQPESDPNDFDFSSLEQAAQNHMAQQQQTIGETPQVNQTIPQQGQQFVPQQNNFSQMQGQQPVVPQNNFQQQPVSQLQPISVPQQNIQQPVIQNQQDVLNVGLQNQAQQQDALNQMNQQIHSFQQNNQANNQQYSQNIPPVDKTTSFEPVNTQKEEEYDEETLPTWKKICFIIGSVVLGIFGGLISFFTLKNKGEKNKKFGTLCLIIGGALTALSLIINLLILPMVTGTSFIDSITGNSSSPENLYDGEYKSYSEQGSSKDTQEIINSLNDELSAGDMYGMSVRVKSMENNSTMVVNINIDSKEFKNYTGYDFKTVSSDEIKDYFNKKLGSSINSYNDIIIDYCKKDYGIDVTSVRWDVTIDNSFVFSFDDASVLSSGGSAT